MPERGRKVVEIADARPAIVCSGSMQVTVSNICLQGGFVLITSQTRRERRCVSVRSSIISLHKQLPAAANVAVENSVYKSDLDVESAN